MAVNRLRSSNKFVDESSPIKQFFMTHSQPAPYAHARQRDVAAVKFLLDVGADRCVSVVTSNNYVAGFVRCHSVINLVHVYIYTLLLLSARLFRSQSAFNDHQ